MPGSTTSASLEEMERRFCWVCATVGTLLALAIAAHGVAAQATFGLL